MSVRQAVTIDEIRRMLVAAPNEQQALFIALLWYTGGRCSEVLSIQPDNIDKGVIIMPNLKQHNKNGKVPYKVVYVPEVVTSRIQAYIEENEITGFLFSGNGLKAWHRGSAWKIVKRIAATADVIKVGRNGKFTPAWPHTARHGNAEYLYAKTKDILFVRDQLGHSNLQNTQVYAVVSSEQRKRLVEEVFAELPT